MSLPAWRLCSVQLLYLLQSCQFQPLQPSCSSTPLGSCSLCCGSTPLWKFQFLNKQTRFNNNAVSKVAYFHNLDKIFPIDLWPEFMRGLTREWLLPGKSWRGRWGWQWCPMQIITASNMCFSLFPSLLSVSTFHWPEWEKSDFCFTCKTLVWAPKKKQ